MQFSVPAVNLTHHFLVNVHSRYEHKGEIINVIYPRISVFRVQLDNQYG